MNNTKTIEHWRAEKQRLDAGRTVEDVLGCVGYPLFEYLQQVGIEEDPELLWACMAARDNLLSLVNENRTAAVQVAGEYLAGHIAELDYTDLGLDADDSPNDAAAKAFERASHEAQYIDESYIHHITLEELP